MTLFYAAVATGCALLAILEFRNGVRQVCWELHGIKRNLHQDDGLAGVVEKAVRVAAHAQKVADDLVALTQDDKQGAL